MKEENEVGSLMMAVIARGRFLLWRRVYLIQEVWQRLDRFYTASAVDKRTSSRLLIQYWTGWLVPRRRNTANCTATGWLMDHAETVSEFQSWKLDLGSLT